MNCIPPKLRKQLSEDPEYQKCLRAGSDCQGRITWEHANYSQGRQIQERWSIIPLCVYHHLGKGLNKEYNQFLSLRRATEEDLAKYPRSDFKQKLKYLTTKYE